MFVYIFIATKMLHCLAIGPDLKIQVDFEQTNINMPGNNGLRHIVYKHGDFFAEVSFSNKNMLIEKKAISVIMTWWV